MSGLAAGDLNRLVAIRRPTGAVDAANQPTGAMEDFVSVWASIRGSSGMGVVKGSADAPISSYSVRVRHRTDITTGMQAVLGTIIMEIEEVRQDHAGRAWTDLVCRVINA